jgi:ribosomal protein S18 acetylase RimI-like enzyme
VLDSLFKDYFLELEGALTFSNKNAFIVYKVVDKECYISHMYVEPTHRNAGFGKKLFSHLVNTLKKQDVEEVSCNIFKADKGWQKNKQIYLSQGFQIVSENDNVITMSKGL